MFQVEKSLVRNIICSCYRNYSRTVKYKKDPGIKERGKILNPEEVDDMNLDLDDLETDFMNVHQSHKQHIREMEIKQEKLKYLIVKQKYFKEKFPNFLTWQDKEQIRYLHNKDPQEWTIEQLSDSFPALPETIQKILKSDFSKSQTKIVNHDASVQKNWKSFKRGEMPDLPKDLVEHLKKFTQRIAVNNSTSLATPKTKREVVVQPNMPTDFSEIITSYQRLKNKNQPQEVTEDIKTNTKLPNLQANSEHLDTFLTIDKKSMKNRKNITLTQLQNKIEIKALAGDSLSEEEKLILKEVHPPNKSEVSLTQANEEDKTIISNKFGSTGGSLVKKTERDYSHLLYPEKIKIPKELKKRGYTYRLNDCYYDYDGEFLYRVPGMG